MDLRETRRINDRLAQIHSSVPRPRDLRIDTFRHPYVKFSAPYLMPAVSLGGIEGAEALQLIEVVAERIPEFAAGCHILPEPRPRRESAHVHLVREIDHAEGRFLYIFNLNAEYMGGAEDSEIASRALQGRAPSFRTDRMYFQARLVPVEEIQRTDGQIVDFRVRRPRQSYHTTVSRGEWKPGDLWTNFVFDDADFSSFHRAFTERLGGGAPWPLSKLFFPFLLEYATVCLNLVNPGYEMARALADWFAPAAHEIITDELDPARLAPIQAFWKAYFAAWEYEPAPSRSGNPHWKLLKYPDFDWLQQSAPQR
jgi:hypothetical protein